MSANLFARLAFRILPRGLRPPPVRDSKGTSRPLTRYHAVMSRAFVKETAESAAPPERMVDDGPNLVTPEGLAQIEGHIARIEAAMKSETNVLLRETLARDLRYWEIRRSTAEVVPPGCDGAVAFGCTATIARKGRQQTFRIVGVDEADAAKGLISFRAPLAAAILGSRVGDIVEANEPLGDVEIISVG
jgi:transcription elongation GreA/GreB family factor